MSAKSESQRKFMWAVYNIQKGKSPVRGKAGKAASEMNPEDVKDFLMEKVGLKKCDIGVKRRLLQTLKEIQEPMNLEHVSEEPTTPPAVASTTTAHGDFDQTLNMYRGFELTPKENQAIQNFIEAKPSVHDKFKVQYAKSDGFTNNSTIVVKKLREPNGQFVYTALVKVRGNQPPPVAPPAGPPPETPPATPSPNAGPTGGPPKPPTPMKEQEEAGDEIKVIKSIPFGGKEGSEILTNFLQAVYHSQA